MYHTPLFADSFKPAGIELTNWTTAGSHQKTGSNAEPLVTMWRVERGNTSFDKGRSRKTSKVGATSKAKDTNTFKWTAKKNLGNQVLGWVP